MRYLLLAVVVACSSSSSPPASTNAVTQNPPQKRSATQILNDSALWGPDLPTLLANVEGLQRANQREVWVFPDRAVVTTPFKSETEARTVADTINKNLSDLRANPTPIARTMSARAPLKNIQAAVIQQFPDDRSVRVALESVQLLPPDLTVATVRQRAGAPERTTRQLIEGPGESRPLILTLYSYAGGTITFAEADIAARPGFVNRVKLDVPAVTAALAKEAK
ncbi:MAG TPA: hypothetical protein VH740_07390 [Vicinamibacterales bacterium]|jgi:hypothetical protein